MVSEVMDMSDEKKTPQEVKITRLRKLTRKRWFYPAVYLSAVAIVLAAAFLIQHSLNDRKPNANEHGKTALNQKDKEAIPVTGAKEVFQWPVLDKDSVEIAMPFYDVNADEKEQEAALVNYNNTYVPNKGICIVAKDGKSFDVTASVSGKVVRAEKDDLLGYVVEIQHKDGVNTVYDSLGSIAVEKGQTVSQGDVIGTAGENKFMKDLGVHLHFEIRKDGVAVDPVAYFQKTVASLDKVTKTNNKATGEKSGSGDDTRNDNGAKNNDGSNNDNRDQNKTNQDSTDQGTSGGSHDDTSSTDSGTSLDGGEGADTAP